MSQLPFQIIGFDLDGTLTDSAPGIWAGFRHAMTVIGEPEPTDAMLSTVVGPPLLDSFVAFGLDTARAEAERLLSELAAGADFVKFQYFKPNLLSTRSAKQANYQKIINVILLI